MIVRITAAATGIALCGVVIANDGLTSDVSEADLNDEFYIEADEPFTGAGSAELSYDEVNYEEL